MSTETHTIPDDTAAHYERLITEAEKMRQAGADALKAAYADLRADLKQLGWAGASISAEVAAFKGAIAEMALAEADKTKRDEKGERIGDYVSLLTRARARGQRKIGEQFDPITGEFVDDGEVNAKLVATVATGMQTDIGRKALVKALDIMIEREEAEERRSDLGLNILTKHEDIRTAPETADEMDRSTKSSFAARSGEAENARKAIPAGPEDGSVTHAGAGEIPATDQPLTGGDHEVAGIAPRERETVTSNTGEGAANTALPAAGVVMEYVPPTGMKRLPFAHCFPDHSKTEYDRLEKDIAANRVREPIIRQGDVIVDGWARYNISRVYGISYPIREIDAGRDVLLDVIEWQRAARNFTPAQERKIAAELAKEFPHRADDIMSAFGLAEALEAAE